MYKDIKHLFDAIELTEQDKWDLKNMAIGIKWQMPPEEQVKFDTMLRNREEATAHKLAEGIAEYDKLASRPNKRKMSKMSSNIMWAVSYLSAYIPMGILAKMALVSGNMDMLSAISTTAVGGSVLGTMAYFFNKYGYKEKPISSIIENYFKERALDKIHSAVVKDKIDTYFKSCLYSDRQPTYMEEQSTM